MGQAISDGTLFFAADVAKALTGVLSLAVVIGGVVLIAGVGGRGVQEFLRHWLWQAVLGVIFVGSFAAIANQITTNFK
jgi:hypothetical protein